MKLKDLIVDEKSVVFSFTASSDECADFEKFVDFRSAFDAEFEENYGVDEVKMSTVFAADIKDFLMQELNWVHEDDKDIVDEMIEAVVAETDVSSYTVLSFNVASEQDYLIVILNK